MINWKVSYGILGMLLALIGAATGSLETLMLSAAFIGSSAIQFVFGLSDGQTATISAPVSAQQHGA